MEENNERISVTQLKYFESELDKVYKEVCKYADYAMNEKLKENYYRWVSVFIKALEEKAISLEKVNRNTYKLLIDKSKMNKPIENYYQEYKEVLKRHSSVAIEYIVDAAAYSLYKLLNESHYSPLVYLTIDNALTKRVHDLSSPYNHIFNLIREKIRWKYEIETS